VGRNTCNLGGEKLNKIEALAEVARDEKRSEIERNAAIAALKNLAASAETFHERQSAGYVLESLDAVKPPNEIPIPDN